jgi:hypothetical protein
VRESSEESALQCQPAQTPQISGVIVTLGTSKWSAAEKHRENPGS